MFIFILHHFAREQIDLWILEQRISPGNCTRSVRGTVQEAFRDGCGDSVSRLCCHDVIIWGETWRRRCRTAHSLNLTLFFAVEYHSNTVYYISRSSPRICLIVAPPAIHRYSKGRLTRCTSISWYPLLKLNTEKTRGKPRKLQNSTNQT